MNYNLPMLSNVFRWCTERVTFPRRYQTVSRWSPVTGSRWYSACHTWYV